MTTTMTGTSRPAPTPAGTVRVTVAVPTYRRPDDLADLLPLLREQVLQVCSTPGSRYRADILVVDNDPEGSAAGIVAGRSGVRYVAEPTPGIAAVRNRALDESGDARVIAFIDDDERPADGWLAHLLGTWAATGAAAVSGRVLAQYAGDLDPWIEAGRFFVRRALPTGSLVEVAATNNLLLDLDQVRRSGVRFESTLGLGGGEDSLFTRSLVRAGGRIIWCDESVVVDQVPLARMTRAWVLTRAWSHGNSSVLTDLRLARRFPIRLVLRIRWGTSGLLRIAGGAARWAWGVTGRSLRHRARGLRAVFRGAGMIAGALGVVYVEYARSGRHWRLDRGGTR